MSLGGLSLIRCKWFQPAPAWGRRNHCYDEHTQGHGCCPGEGAGFQSGEMLDAAPVAARELSGARAGLGGRSGPPGARRGGRIDRPGRGCSRR